SVTSKDPIGCLMETAPAEGATGKLTFNRDIAPILHASCARCHRPGQSAPFSLITYADAAAHARQIVQVTKSRQMPPWKPMPGFAQFKDERRLSDREIALLAAWADSGMPQGNSEDLPTPPKFSDDWQLGKPDV